MSRRDTAKANEPRIESPRPRTEETVHGPSPPTSRRHRFTVDEYHRMGEVGILHEDDRVELILGEIIDMTPIGSPHASCVGRMVRLFIGRLGERVFVWPHNPVVLSSDTEPQPDLVLLRPRADDYARGHPTPEAMYLVVEVADTTLAFDRRTKAPLYASRGVSDLWIVDLSGQAVEVYREPSQGRHANVKRHGRGERIAPLAFPDVPFDVSEILG